MSVFWNGWQTTLNAALPKLSHLGSSLRPRLLGVSKLRPPKFADSKGPLDADDWLKTIERKFNALRVQARDHVNFATYKLEGAAGAWWEGFLALQAPEHEVTW